MIKLNVGCGHIQPDGWVNIDSSNRARLASWLPWLDKSLVALGALSPTEFNSKVKVCNVTKRLPYADDSVGGIYSGEMLEHLTYEDGMRFLRECHRILEPGGALRIRVPDTYLDCKRFVDDYESHRQRRREEWGAWHERSHWHARGFYANVCTKRLWLGSMGHYHKWNYDEMSLILDFEKAGFVEVERRLKHDSRIDDIAAVETRQNLIVEGIKPARQPEFGRRPESQSIGDCE